MSLDQYRVEGDPSALDVKPLRVTEGFSGTLLVMDQTLTKTGWAALGVGTLPEIIETGMIRTEVIGKGGYKDTFRRAVEYDKALASLISRLWPDAIVHETPVTGPKMKRTDSSLIAAILIETAAARRGIPVHVVSGTTMKKRLTGDSSASKAQVQVVVKRYLDTDDVRPFNQDISDGCGLGLAWLDNPRIAL